MKKILWIMALCAMSMGAWAIVPPRSINDMAAYNAMKRHLYRSSNAPMREQAVGTARVFPKVVVIMVNYSNIAFRISRADVDSMFNAQHFTKDGATGSVRQYFYDQSDGRYNPQFDIYGPVTVNGNCYAYKSREGQMVVEACDLMNDSLDFSQYDLDGDGKVDLVYCLYAGPGASDANGIDQTWISNPGNLIWPHYFRTSSTARFDGKRIYDYEVSSELDGYESNATTAVQMGVGLACHEFGHALGLPDIYATSEQYTHKTCGMWDVMDYGCYNNNVHTPPSYSAYERWFMGWRTPRVLADPETVNLAAINTGGETLIISPTGAHNLDGVYPNPAEFYMLENRQKTGWDIGIPGNGLMLTHIRYDNGKWTGNTVNNNASEMGVDIVEADGVAPSSSQGDGWYGKQTDLFPAGATSFTVFESDSVTNITMNNQIVSFLYKGGDPEPLPSVLDENETEPVTSRKILRDGRIYILRNGKEYDILGHENNKL